MAETGKNHSDETKRWFPCQSDGPERGGMRQRGTSIRQVPGRVAQ